MWPSKARNIFLFTHVKKKKNISSPKLTSHIDIFTMYPFCAVSASSNFHDVPLSFRHGEHVQCRSEESSQKTEPFQHRKGTSGIPGGQKGVPVQLGCVISGMQLWGQPEEPWSSDRSQQGQQKSCEKELCSTGNSGKGERLFLSFKVSI